MACILINKDGDEITRYGFISHMEDYLKQLRMNPASACPDEYLQSHGIDGELALKSLLAKTDPMDDESAILLRKETIKTNPDGGRDIFSIKYRIPKKNYIKKMRNLYCSLFENHINYGTILNECDCAGCAGGGEPGGGAVTADASGQYDAPAFGKKPIRRTLVLSEKQIGYLKEAVEMGTMFGDFGFDAPGLETKGDFWKPSLVHRKKNGAISTERLKEEEKEQ